MTNNIWEFTVTGPLVEGPLMGLAFGLLALVVVCVVAALAVRVFHVLNRGDGCHLDRNDLPKMFRHKHGTT